MAAIPIALKEYLNHSESAVTVLDISGQSHYANNTFARAHNNYNLLLLLTSAFDRQKLLQCLHRVSQKKIPENLSLQCPTSVQFQVAQMAQTELFILTARPNNAASDTSNLDSQRFADQTAFINLVPVALARHDCAGQILWMNDGWWKTFRELILLRIGLRVDPSIQYWTSKRTILTIGLLRSIQKILNQ